MTGRRRPAVPPWVVLLAILVVTALWSLFPLYTPRTPGTLHLAVIDGEDPATLQRAFGPLADHLGRAVRRDGTVRAVSSTMIADGTHQADLLLVPHGHALAAGYELLAWAKEVGHVGSGTPLVLVSRRGRPDPEAAWALGDEGVLGGAEAAREALEDRGVILGPEPPMIGRSPYRHDEVLALLAHGSVERAVVRRADFDRNVAAGVLDPGSVRVEVLGRPMPRFALVAAPSLSEPARRRARARALTIDAQRLNPRNQTVRIVVTAQAQLGVGGFSPVEPFPSLRP